MIGERLFWPHADDSLWFARVKLLWLIPLVGFGILWLIVTREIRDAWPDVRTLPQDIADYWRRGY